MGIQRFEFTPYGMVANDEAGYVLFADHEQVVAELTKAHQDNLDSWLHQREEIAFLRAELAAKSKDAARYAWLRGDNGGLPHGIQWATNDLFDTFVDEAMGEGNGR